MIINYLTPKLVLCTNPQLLVNYLLSAETSIVVGLNVGQDAAQGVGIRFLIVYDGNGTTGTSREWVANAPLRNGKL